MKELEGAVDCDVHPHFKRGLEDLSPYVDGDAWRHRLGMSKAGSGGLELPGVASPLTHTQYINPGAPFRADATPPEGGPPNSDPEFTKLDLLDRQGLEAAVLVGGNILGLGGIPNADVAAEIAAAHNRWLDDVWLRADPRFKGAITIAPHDPVKAVKEIEVWADHPAMVEVFIPDRAGLLLGNRHFYPVYEAAEHFGLPVAIHPGGASSGTNWGAGMFAGGVPTSFFEYHVAMTELPQSQVISLIAEGVFERFPDLTAVITEGGFAWLPHVLWCMDKDWKSFRDEVPWIKHLPSEYVLDRIRITTQPFAEPSDPAHLEAVLDMIHAKEILMFSTDYPHYDGDEPARVARSLPGDIRERVMRGNAIDTYPKLRTVAASR
jgi:predicted TIM-barrel fold metal-dependent hydrolase